MLKQMLDRYRKIHTLEQNGSVFQNKYKQEFEIEMMQKMQ
jgi:hypothetical protein